MHANFAAVQTMAVLIFLPSLLEVRLSKSPESKNNFLFNFALRKYRYHQYIVIADILGQKYRYRITFKIPTSRRCPCDAMHWQLYKYFSWRGPTFIKRMWLHLQATAQHVNRQYDRSNNLTLL